MISYVDEKYDDRHVIKQSHIQALKDELDDKIVELNTNLSMLQSKYGLIIERQDGNDS